ncbi:hypothetical protein ACCT08_28400, partial [Rhizobium johnstonii]|uniref:hypothetical protein n=1 Tax=Rhizobium johnstonii TaxID=3019933 RepID=UPI003F9CE7A5
GNPDNRQGPGAGAGNGDLTALRKGLNAGNPMAKEVRRDGARKPNSSLEHDSDFRPIGPKIILI